MKKALICLVVLSVVSVACGYRSYLRLWQPKTTIKEVNFKAPVRGLFAGDETVTPNGAYDIMPYVGRKRALGCALFPMY